jgi:hypothetical protein
VNTHTLHRTAEREADTIGDIHFESEIQKSYMSRDRQVVGDMFNNNNNNLFLRSRPSQHTKLVYETPLFVGQGTPLRPAISLVKSTKVYIPYPPLDLNL